MISVGITALMVPISRKKFWQRNYFPLIFRHVEDVEYKYRLVAVIVHRGPKLREGHNFAYVRASQIGGQQQESSGTPSWFCANDESITQVSLQQVLECQAYMLFYERVELPKAEPVVEEHLPTDH
uniref:USP domain-containing protein n=1 Tax=Triticum urartu TaxID=4572 RepID=A0A8R7P8B3_TRIUA